MATPIPAIRSPAPRRWRTLDVYCDERLFERAKKLEPKWYDVIMSL